MLMSLICSIFISSLGSVTATNATTNTPNVTITGISSSASEVTDGQQIKLTVNFKGNGHVKAGDTITMDLPQPTDDNGGLYGIKTTIPLNATYKDNGVEKTLDDVATANVQFDQVVITFNNNKETSI